MGNLEAFADYMPPTWLSQGVFFNYVAKSTKRAAKAVVTGVAAAAVAAASVVVTPNLAVPVDSAVGWPPTPMEQQQSQAIAAFHATLSRIDNKVSTFLTTGPARIDQELVAEARLTLAMIAERQA